MRRELLLIGEMIEAAEQARSLVAGIDIDTLAGDRLRRDALLWNFTVLGEAAAQIDADIKARSPTSSAAFSPRSTTRDRSPTRFGVSHRAIAT